MGNRAFGKNEIKAVSAKVTLAQELGNAGYRRISETQTRIEAAIEEAVKPEWMRTLRGIPVDELNMNKAGIRTNVLKEAGYGDIYSVYAASTQNLASVYGIGETMAQRAKENANRIASDVSNNVKLRISTDHKTEEYSRLVAAVAEHMRAKEALPKCERLLAMLPSDPKGEIEKVQCASNGVKWFFSGGKKKEAAQGAYDVLSASASSIDNSGLIPEIQGDGLPITIASAWSDFASRPVEYYHVLEEIAPERFDSDEDGYGLSDEIRESVENTKVDLTGLKCQLRGYQVWGVKYILQQKRVLLGDEMGLGKTIQALAAMVSLRNEGGTHFLVICPASVIINWCREIESKSDMKAFNLHDSDRDGARSSWIEKGGVAVTNYESLENHFYVEEDFKIDMVVVDEAHYIKNTEARRSKNVLAVCQHTDRILFMTGTPLENRVEEMVRLMDYLQHDVAQQAQQVSMTAYADDFKNKISPVYYRRKRDDVLTELPDLTDIKEWCDMTPEDEKIYEDDIMNGSFMDARRVSWRNDDFLNTSSKVQRLREIVEDAAEDSRKVLVFSFFLDTLEKVRTVFGNMCVGVINGSVPVEERQNIVDAFEAAPAGSVLAAQIQSGGTGLNIQSASVVVLCEPQYKPSTENQAIARAHRMGQTRDVLVHRLLCPNTVDERMLEILEAKQAEFDTFADESSAAKRDAASEAAGETVEVTVRETMEAGVAAGEAEIDNASMNRVFEQERERIMAKRQREQETGAQAEAAYEQQPIVESAPVAAAASAATAMAATAVPEVETPAPATSEPQPIVETTPAEEVSAPVEVPVVQEAPEKVLFCRYCGKKLPVDAVFCSYCGRNIL